MITSSIRTVMAAKLGTVGEYVYPRDKLLYWLAYVNRLVRPLLLC